MKDHEYYQQLISRIADEDQLSKAEQEELDAHLASCEECRAFTEFCGMLQNTDWQMAAPEELAAAVMAEIKPKKRRMIVITRAAAGLAACLVLALGIRAFLSTNTRDTTESSVSAGGSAPMMAMAPAVLNDAESEPERSEDAGGMITASLCENSSMTEEAVCDEAAAENAPAQQSVPSAASEKWNVSSSALLDGIGTLLRGTLTVEEDGSVYFAGEAQESADQENGTSVCFRLDPEAGELPAGVYTGTFTVTGHTSEGENTVLVLFPETCERIDTP